MEATIIHSELERLAVAGAIDKEFCRRLLREPLAAVENYPRDKFRLTAAEKALISTIRTEDFQTFVEIIAQWITDERAQHAGQEVR